jgi:hypothetical protein
VIHIGYEALQLKLRAPEIRPMHGYRAKPYNPSSAVHHPRHFVAVFATPPALSYRNRN